MNLILPGGQGLVKRENIGGRFWPGAARPQILNGSFSGAPSGSLGQQIAHGPRGSGIKNMSLGQSEAAL